MRGALNPVTTPNPSRRNFLRGKFNQADADVMRPPGASADFDQLCTECGDCVSACPESIIRIGEDRRPVVDFSLGSCVFCRECVKVCSPGALADSRVETWPWKAAIKQNCLSIQGVMCRTCEDVCEARAIRFKLEAGGKSRPELNQSQCTGCGACAYSCPSHAITFVRE